MTTPDSFHVPDGPHDIRLVVCDMDGTLLDAAKRIPDALWPLVDHMRERGIVFAPASGRQHATLARQFERLGEGLVVIAENGSYVARGGVEISSSPLPDGVLGDIVTAVRDHARAGFDVGTVVCGKRSAYIERDDAAFVEKASPYYAALEIVDDLAAVDDAILKVAVYDFGNAAHDTAPVLARFQGDLAVVVSDRHWIDIMRTGVHKGVAVARLQEALGVTPEQTVVFGDYLNDLEMMDRGHLSFAMANAHPDVAQRARYRAPSNVDAGVITTLRRLLDHPLTSS
ncbi:HAD family hydrolase [Demequina sp. SYSU T00068]|uniref:HAD family hydrolase n=1 Tax=Demequina lignilytica TaxID=3051663 RepID=UPI00260EC251|nr:HAD family hydrolase [Demequina sp. SYSU T00068]MDN4489331.1 HAD family hydrolase [Demequina sp. SYSU T00068]